MALALLPAPGCAPPPPAIADLAWTPNADPAVSLAVTVRFTTDRPTRPLIVLDDGERPVTIDRWPDPATEHELLLLGFHPGRDCEVRLSAVDEAGMIAEAPV